MHMRRAVRGWIGIGVAGLAVTACIPRVQQPEIWLGGVRLASLGLNGGVVDVRLSVYNPNRFDLDASGLTYDLDLGDPEGDGWIDFTEGTLDQRLRVGSRDTADVVIPVEFSFRSLGQLSRSLLERGTLEYRVRGAVALEGPIRRDIGYRHEGTVSPSGIR